MTSYNLNNQKAYPLKTTHTGGNMIRKFHVKSILAAAALFAGTAIIFGCASAQSLIDKGDPVGAIEKLAKNLSNPKKVKAEEVDMFVSLYPTEVENRLEYTSKTVKGLSNDFARSQGKSDINSALKAKRDKLPATTFITDDSDVRNLLRQAEDLEKNLKDLRRIQKAVATMPEEIENPSTGDSYTVEKYTENFTSMSLNADKELGALYVQLAECENPGKNRSAKEGIYKLFDKAKEMDSTISRIDERRAQAAYMAAEDYLTLGSTIDEKKSALDWYRKSRYAVSNYSDTTEKIKQCNYEIGIFTMAAIDEEGSVSGIKSALSNAKLNFKEAGDYKDAAEWVAKIEAIQYEIDHPQKKETAQSSSGSSAPEGFVLIKAPSFKANQVYADPEIGEHFLTKANVKLSRSYYICEHEVTVKEVNEITSKYGFNFTWASRAEPTDDCAWAGFTWVEAIAYCNLRSMNENLKPVYTYKGESDPRKWPFTLKFKDEGKNKYHIEWYNSYITGERGDPDFERPYAALDIEMNMDANGYRMPIEAEWDYASLGDFVNNKKWTNADIYLLTNRCYSDLYIGPAIFAGYDGSDTQDRDEYVHEWNDNYPTEDKPIIKQKKPNSYGLYDMTGNVPELVWDSAYFYDQASDIREWTTYSKLGEKDPINSDKSFAKKVKSIFAGVSRGEYEDTRDFDSPGGNFQMMLVNGNGLRLVRTAK